MSPTLLKLLTEHQRGMTVVNGRGHFSTDRWYGRRLLRIFTDIRVMEREPCC